MLASDWLTALSVTVIIPIQLTERHTEKGRTRERQREGVRERERGRRRTIGLLVGFWLIECREKSCLGAPCPGGWWLCPRRRRAPAELPDIRWTSRTPVVHYCRLAVAALLSFAAEPRPLAHLSVFNRRAPRECTAVAPPARPGPRPPGHRDRGDRLPCTEAWCPRRLFFLYPMAVPEPRKC